MSKKAHKNQPQKKEIDIVDQQKDPMLRALQKKVRNMNKKLNQITELAAKKDLKPEQEQKISKKNQILQEKEKYLQMIETYKEISGESQKAIRKLQIVELQDLASLVAIKEYQVDLGFLFNQNVDNLVRILTTPTSGELTLKERIDQIANSLTQTANNTKLKKTIRDYVQQNPTKQKVPPQTVSNQPEPLSSQSQKERQAQIKQLQEEEKNEQQKVVNESAPVSNPPVQETKTQVVQAPQVAEQVNQKPQENPQTVSAPAPVLTQDNKVPAEKPNDNDQPKTAQNQQNNNGKPQRRGYNRGYKGGRGEKNNERYNGERKPYKKPSFKPKYQETKKTEARDESSSLESSDQQPKARQFKREQVRELIEDGFIVVGKPKVKARDQKQWHDHQHGRKNYHNKNSKTNY